MAKVIINDSTLTAIGDAIRSKTNSTETYKPSEMPQAISSIASNSNDLVETISGLNYSNLSNEEVMRILNIIKEIEPLFSGIYSVGAYLFYGQEKITDIHIPEGITELDYSCFNQCNNLVNVNLSNTITHIRDNAFRGTDLTTITLPASLEHLGIYALGYCEKLNTVYFKGKPSYIHGLAFKFSENITDIYVPWSEGEVANAPWGATNATIHYNYTEEV